jgi:hypothetical protein
MNAIHSEVWLCLDANTEVPKRPPYQNSGMWMQVSLLPTNSSFQILLDINVHCNRRPLTILRFCWRPFWKWWPRKNDPECKFHHYQPIPHFKITLDINFHWNQRTLKFCRFCRRPFWKWRPIARDFVGQKIPPTLLNI